MWVAGHTVSGAAAAAPLDATWALPPSADGPPVPPGEIAPADVEAVDNGAAGGWVIECVNCPNVRSVTGNNIVGTSMVVDSKGYPHVAFFSDPDDDGMGDLHYGFQDVTGWHSEKVGHDMGVWESSISLALDQDEYPHVAFLLDPNNDGWGNLYYGFQDATGWYTEEVRHGMGVWESSVSLALDQEGNPHLGYASHYDDGVWYAYRDPGKGIWHFESVDDLGFYASLALDGDGNPHMSYQHMATTWTYAYRDAGVWHTEPLVEFGYFAASHTSIAVDGSGHPHIGCNADLAGEYDLWYAAYDGSTWYTATVDTGIGWHTRFSLDVDDANYAHVAYRHSDEQDLRYVYLDVSGWHTETVDSKGLVGFYPSLALDGGGYPHVFYSDETNDELKYAYQDASGWHVQQPLGWHTSLALDGDGYAHISYYDYTGGGLKYAYQDTSGWYSQTVDSSGDVGLYTSLALAGDGYPRISYYDATNDDLKYTYLDGSGWHSQTVDSAGSVGIYTSLALASTAPYTPHISYYDASNEHPKYAYLDGAGWYSQTVGTGFPAGQYTSLVLGSNGYPHISYYCHYFGDLRYTRQISPTGWTESVVAYYSESWNKVGKFNSLALDASGNPYISYYDEFLGALRVATGWAPVGWSTMWTVDSVPAWHTSLVMSGTYAHISYYDALHGTLKYAYQDASGWYSQTVDSDGNVGQYTSLALDGDGHPHISYYDADCHGLKHAYYSIRPVADFLASPTTGDRPLTVVFTDTSAGGEVDTWLWEFGDGLTSTLESPIHIYTAAGVYTVTLAVSGAGGSDTLTRANYIAVTEPPPVAGFTAHPTSDDRPLMVVFTDTSIGTITVWDWAFGDEGVSSQQNPTHTYTSAGVYTVSLTVSGPGGSDTLSRTNYITVTEPPPAPQVDFSGAPRSGKAPLMVQFTSTVTGTVTAYGWLFGDGGIADTPNPTHTYASAGNFCVTLVVTGPGGIADVSKHGYITVNAPPGAPTATFSADVVSGTVPLTVTFTAITSGTVEHWLWNFGDGGTTFTGPVVSHTYVTSGTFDVSLTVSNTHGSFVVSKPGYVTVREKGEGPSYFVYLPLVMRSYEPLH